MGSHMAEDPYVPDPIKKLAQIEYDLIQDLLILFKGKKPDNLEGNIENYLKAIAELDISAFGENIYLHFGWVGRTINDLVKAIDPALLVYPSIALQDLVLLPMTIKLLENPQNLAKDRDQVMFFVQLANNTHLMERLKRGLIVYVPHSTYLLYLAKKNEKTLADYINSSIIAEALGASLEIAGSITELPGFQREPFVNAVRVSLIYNIRLYSSDEFLSSMVSASANLIDMAVRFARKRGLDLDINAMILEFSKIIEDLKSSRIVRIMQKSLETYTRQNIIPIERISIARSKIDIKELRTKLVKEDDPDRVISDVKEYLDSQFSDAPQGILEILGLMGLNATALFFGINPLLAIGIGAVALISRSLSAMTKVLSGLKSLFRFLSGRRRDDVALDISKIIRIIDKEKFSKTGYINNFIDLLASIPT